MATTTPSGSGRPTPPGDGPRSPRRVSRASPLPLWAQLADVVRGEIEGGELAPGDPLPSEAELCQIHEVSRTAVRQALAALVDEGLVVKERGRGSFVRRRQVAGLVVTEVRGLLDEMAMHGATLHTQVTLLERSPLPPDAAALLAQPMGSKGVRLDRIRLLGDEPLARTRTWLTSPRLDDLLDVDLGDQSLYQYLGRVHGIRPVGGYRKIEAVAAEASVARDLQVPRGSAVLRMTATNEDADRVPFEWFQAWYRADRVAIELLVETKDAR